MTNNRDRCVVIHKGLAILYLSIIMITDFNNLLSINNLSADKMSALR